MTESERIEGEPELTPEQVQEFVAELERVIGTELASPEMRFEWVLPLSDPEEFLAALRSAPSNVGLAGIEAYLRERLGTLAGLKRVESDPDAPDV
ncbi:MAG TPA: hypothetical protein VF761_01960 [Gemmatimonadaceae bacterium]